jgi:hypothetical protein
MAATPTDYERVNCILPRAMKKELIRWCEDRDISITQALRASIRDLLDRKEFKTCPPPKKKSRH